MFNRFFPGTEQNKLADTPANEKLYKAEYLGSGTFNISKPKRKKTKQRQSHLKNTTRGSRK
ncbi:MAG TPA: hypothetical protein VHY84_03810 [Bryobacteraceae bacterium]|jgi:hypothetical protein|nr:hypothetical protein [Bryobacteraceae bacterium]